MRPRHLPLLGMNLLSYERFVHRKHSVNRCVMFLRGLRQNNSFVAVNLSFSLSNISQQRIILVLSKYAVSAYSRLKNYNCCNSNECLSYMFKVHV